MNHQVLKNVIFDQHEIIKSAEIIERNYIFDPNANYVITGLRRAGKSTILHKIARELVADGANWHQIIYINFEDERLGGMTALDLNLLLETHLEMYGKRPILFLDEIQNIDGWEKFARRLSDNKYRVYITGSNAKMLSNEIQSTLGGRYISVDVYPYSFEEYLRARSFHATAASFYSTEGRAEILALLDDYFRFGGFPERALLASRRDYLTSVYQKIYLGDIAARHKIENTSALRMMFRCSNSS